MKIIIPKSRKLLLFFSNLSMYVLILSFYANCKERGKVATVESYELHRISLKTGLALDERFKLVADEERGMSCVIC